MKLKGLIDEDFANYKKPSMFLIFPSCTFKCEKECGEHCCQNSALAHEPNINIEIETIVNRYMKNEITSAIVCGGMEPIDSWEDLFQFVTCLRSKTLDDIVIYTGFREDEIESKVNQLKQFPNIIIKFGRFIPNQNSHHDQVLGIHLSSDNQYAKVVS